MKNENIRSEVSVYIVDLYIRVSTTEQAMEGYSVGEQEARLRRFCEALGYQIHKVITDPGYSGASLNRSGIKEVIRDVQDHLVSKVFDILLLFFCYSVNVYYLQAT